MDNWFSFAGVQSGEWRIRRIAPVIGETLPPAPALNVRTGAAAGPDAVWRLGGVVSNLRYTQADEAAGLRARQQAPGRPTDSRAVLIPIRKSPAWWALAQDERRAIFEEQSRHIALGLDYLPAISRRLHHSRDHGEPFDFLTWFEFAPEHEPAFDALLVALRATREWDYVEREVEVRLERAA